MCFYCMLNKVAMKIITTVSLLLNICVLCAALYYVLGKNFKENITMVFNKNIFELAQQNSFFRKELVTGHHSQVVIMSIPVGGEIGMERHKVDQTLVFVQGRGQAIINGVASDVFAQHLVFVPAGAEHNFKNTGSEELKLFTIYAPAQHKPGTIEETKYE